MPLVPLFAGQFLWFFFAWSLLAIFVVWPWTTRLSTNDALAVWIAPEMFRVLGVGLLVEPLSPGMPLAFSGLTAAADATTSILAAAAFVALRTEARAARGLVWACTVVGVSDLLVAFPHAVHTGAIDHLATQWYVPVFAGPVMAVAHLGCLRTLWGARSPEGASRLT